MANRVNLHIAPSGFSEGITYLISRSDNHGDAPAGPVIEVYEKQCLKEINEMVDDIARQDSNVSSDFYTKYGFMWSPLPEVFIDGIQVPAVNLEFFPVEKRVHIKRPAIEPNTTKVVTVNYNYLMSRVIDDPTQAQLGVTPKSSVVKTGLMRPTYDWSNEVQLGELHIRQQPPIDSLTLTYTLTMRDDNSGRMSVSVPHSEVLIPNTSDIVYELERKSAAPGSNWVPVMSRADGQFVLMATADITDYAHLPLPLDVTPTGAPQAVKVEIQNPWFEWWKNTRPTHSYRIRSKDERGEISNWTELGTLLTNFKPTKVTVRRKIHNGAPAQYEGTDAITLLVATEESAGTAPAMSFIDDHLVSGKTYSYTFYIDDERGFRSLPFMETTLIP